MRQPVTKSVTQCDQRPSDVVDLTRSAHPPGMARCAREITRLCLAVPPDTPGSAAGWVRSDVRMGPGMTQGARERRWAPAWPVDLTTTLGVLSHGRGDPTIRILGGEVWRATRTPAGPATIHCRRDASEVLVRAWGPGAEHELETIPRVLGALDDPTGFDAGAHPVMAAADRRFGPGWRVLRTERVLEALVPAVLEQRVTGREASRAWAGLVRTFGEPAPGPAGSGAAGSGAAGSGAAGSGMAGSGVGPGATVPRLVVPPDGPGWARIPSWAWHQAGVDPGRARTITAAAGRAEALERLSERSPGEAVRALRSLPGIGVWTAAEVAVRAWGDRDAVSFGDFHLARAIVHALTGRADGDDDQLAELLTPWTGQRARAVRLLQLHSGHTLPRRGPRAAITDHRGR
jgi:3-methyladenine DNA glycosylase/8-oxoguanine DNA glycosylase